MSTTAPWGSWNSPITAELITAKFMHLSQVRVDGPDTYWVETRNAQSGRNVLLRRSPDGSVMEVLPMTEDAELIDVRSKVHEYGGKAYGVYDGMIIVSHGNNGCLYRFDSATSRLRQLTPKLDHRYGDFEIDPVRGLIYAIREDHTAAGNPVNELVSVPLDGRAARDLDAIKVLWQDSDFVAGTALSEDGRFIAFTTWDHPHMIWSQSQLRIAELDFEGGFARVHTLVDETDVSCMQPRWTLDGDLIHVDDSNGWPNFYRTEGFFNHDEHGEHDWTQTLRTRSLHPSPKAFTAAAWTLGLHSFDNLDRDHLICAWAEGGTFHLGTVRLDNGELEEWNTGWSPFGNVACVDGRIVLLADAPDELPAIVQISHGEVEVLRSSSSIDLPSEWVSIPENITWESEPGVQVQGFFYEPKNLRVKELPEGKPPLLILAHDGPTRASRNGLDLRLQYWTTRGFAVLDVNYRGSIGFGRAYRQNLNGHWGEYDVRDCRSAIDAVADRVDTTRVAIAGTSAGAFTALNAAMDPAFSAVTARAAITDLPRLLERVHKYESKFLAQLLGSDDPTDPIWRERSPLHNVDRINIPVLLIHGSEDPIVPRVQADEFYQLLQERGIDSELKMFEGEGHRFRKQENIVAAMLAELFFYRRIWNLPAPEASDPL